MIRLLQFLIYGCFHQWKPTGEFKWTDDHCDGVGVYVVCTKCGHRSHFKTSCIGDWEKDTPND